MSEENFSPSDFLAWRRELAQQFRHLFSQLAATVERDGEQKTFEQYSGALPRFKDKTLFNRCLEMGRRKTTATDDEIFALGREYMDHQ